MTGAIFFQAAISLISLFILVWTVAHNTSPKFRYFIFLAMTTFLYSTGYLLELDAHSLEAAYYGQRIQYYGISFFSVFFYLFVRDYGNRPLKDKRLLAACFVFPFIILVLVNAYPECTLYFERLGFDEDPTPHLVIRRGVLFHLHVLYSLYFIFLSLLEVVLFYPKTSREEKIKRMMFIMAAIIPNCAMLILVIDHMPVPLQFGSASLVISLLILGFYIVVHRAQDWLPFARQNIVEHLNDGFVLIDNQNCFLDANAVALQYFPEMAGAQPGTPVTEIAGFPNDLLVDSQPACELTISLAGGEEKFLRVSPTPIDMDGRRICTCVLLYDITEIKRLMLELEEIATRDALTGLYNRGTFFRTVSRDFDLHLRTAQPAALIMLDIDHFKHVNDCYGHPFGDTVLKEISGLILSRLRHTDIGGRYGGEEFILFLPATQIHGALMVASDIRRSTEQLSFINNGENVKVTISIGIAMLDPYSHRSLDEIIEEADKALYKAKNTGRNRICTYRDPMKCEL